jgi:hypothetical protein
MGFLALEGNDWAVGCAVVEQALEMIDVVEAKKIQVLSKLIGGEVGGQIGRMFPS